MVDEDDEMVEDDVCDDVGSTRVMKSFEIVWRNNGVFKRDDKDEVVEGDVCDDVDEDVEVGVEIGVLLQVCL